MSNTLNAGDWAVLGDDIVQIKKSDGVNFIVTTGFIETSGRLGDRLVPLNITTKATAESVKSMCDEMHKLCRCVNWPELSTWIECQVAGTFDDDDARSKFLGKLKQMRRQLEDMQNTIFEAVPEMRVFCRRS